MSSGASFVNFDNYPWTSEWPPANSGRANILNSSEFTRIEYCDIYFKKRSKKYLLSTINFASLFPTAFFGGMQGTNSPGHPEHRTYLSVKNSL